MIRTLLGRLAGWFGSDSEDEEDSSFLPSRLDASVLESHGMGTPEAERELASIQQKAEMLEDQQQDPRNR